MISKLTLIRDAHTFDQPKFLDVENYLHWHVVIKYIKVIMYIMNRVWQNKKIKKKKDQ